MARASLFKNITTEKVRSAMHHMADGAANAAIIFGAFSFFAALIMCAPGMAVFGPGAIAICKSITVGCVAAVGSACVMGAIACRIARATGFFHAHIESAGAQENCQTIGLCFAMSCVLAGGAGAGYASYKPEPAEPVKFLVQRGALSAALAEAQQDRAIAKAAVNSARRSLAVSARAGK